ncbi:uncharacterized protein [Miscanthus floridulus]|uniref:uncharacterized protein n=1 Tax=Miscanthus floridulus TaxID=154761 RepID=UPI003459449B
MSEDYRRNNQTTFMVEQMVLMDIKKLLQSMQKDIKMYPLPDIDDTYDACRDIPREIFEEASIEANEDGVALSDTLNMEQRAAYDEIMSSVDTEGGGLFFVDGPGGTKKTYLYRALVATIRSQKKIVVATTTSGVAASIMPGGRTAHSCFKIPLTIDNGAFCTFTKQSGTAKLLRASSLIIWDEASITKRHSIEALDNSLHDIMDRPELSFSGKTVVFGEDFRHVLPVVRRGSRAQVVGSSLHMSYLWDSMRHLKLVRNMRAKSDPWFAEYLLRIDEGSKEVTIDDEIRLPHDICIPHNGEDSDLDTLIDCIFPNLNANMSSKDYITSRAILSTWNNWVDMINMKMIARHERQWLPGNNPWPVVAWLPTPWVAVGRVGHPMPWKDGRGFGAGQPGLAAVAEEKGALLVEAVCAVLVEAMGAEE